MLSAEAYLSNVRSIMDEFIADNQVVVNFEDGEEAKNHLKRIRFKQKQLRQVKKGVNHSMKTIRSSFTSQKAEIGKPSFTTGFVGGLLGKKRLGKMNALSKENLRRQQNAKLSPYETVVQFIDQSLLILDDLKLQLEKWIMENSRE